MNRQSLTNWTQMRVAKAMRQATRHQDGDMEWIAIMRAVTDEIIDEVFDRIECS